MSAAAAGGLRRAELPPPVRWIEPACWAEPGGLKRLHVPPRPGADAQPGRPVCRIQDGGGVRSIHHFPIDLGSHLRSTSDLAALIKVADEWPDQVSNLDI